MLANRITAIIEKMVNDWAGNYGDAYMRIDHCEVIAQVVLADMRTPDAEMIEAGARAAATYDTDAFKAVAAWQAMIDEASNAG